MNMSTQDKTDSDPRHEEDQSSPASEDNKTGLIVCVQSHCSTVTQYCHYRRMMPTTYCSMSHCPVELIMCLCCFCISGMPYNRKFKDVQSC